jgi:prepilin-type N-terminal cleavage/methylation domain-containing protein
MKSPLTKDHRNGFTLIELIVSISVFSVLVTIAVGGFANVLRTQRQVAGLLVTNSNAALILEQMAREMRTGRQFSCAGSCIGTETILFTNFEGDAIEYSYDPGEKAIYRFSGGVPNIITSRSVSVEYMRFDVENNALYPADSYPTRVTIFLGMGPKDATLARNVLNFQTVVSARFDQ